MRRMINGIVVIGLAGLLVWAAYQASATRQAGWFLLLGVQLVFFILASIQAVYSKE